MIESQDKMHPSDGQKKIQVAAYYFPNFHVDPQNERVHGPGWTEWELLRHAKPRFPGHRQPLMPLWGCEDESDPQVMGKKIDAALAHGVGCFIFDWYWHDGGPFLQRCLDEGFLRAGNVGDMQFACMWANHDWIDIHPAKFSANPFADARLLSRGTVRPDVFDALTDHLVDKYFVHPSYLWVNGSPYFSVYELTKLVAGFGSVDATRRALDGFRDKARRAGLPGVHLNAILWGEPILPRETKPADPHRLLADLGFDSFASYVSVHHGYPDVFPATEYDELCRRYFDYWDGLAPAATLPYVPNVTMGWDPSPRTLPSDVNAPLVYPFGPVVVGNTPERFREALAQSRRRLLADPDRHLPILTVNAWNEWTEGSYLEPDTHHGLGYLEAIRDVFGTKHVSPEAK